MGTPRLLENGGAGRPAHRATMGRESQVACVSTFVSLGTDLGNGDTRKDFLLLFSLRHSEQGWPQMDLSWPPYRPPSSHCKRRNEIEGRGGRGHSYLHVGAESMKFPAELLLCARHRAQYQGHKNE